MATSPPPPIDPRDAAFIREVDEAYREDELKRLFNRYGRWVLLAVGIGLAAFGGWLWWQAEQGHRAEQMSEQFVGALSQIDSGATEGTAKTLGEIRQSGNPTYRALASLAEAGVALAKSDDARAATLYEGVADDAKVPQALRDAATLRFVSARFDQLDTPQVLAKLQPYLSDDSLWFPVAAELAATAHLRAGDRKTAADLFYRIAASERAPQSLRARSEQMVASLGRDVTELVERRASAGAPAADGMGVADAAAPPAADAGQGETTP